MGSASRGQVWASTERQPEPLRIQLFQGWNVCGGIHCNTSWVESESITLG